MNRLPNKLIIDEVAYARQGLMLFRGLNFCLEPENFMMVKGENGIGKTSLLRLLSGLAAPESGNIHLGEWDQKHHNQLYRNNIACLTHQDTIKHDLSVTENLDFWAGIYDLSHDLVQENIDFWGLKERKYQRAGQLSMGLKRRLGLARLQLLQHLPLWLMDEPMTGLDETARQCWALMVEQYLKSGGMVIASSHEALPINADISLALGDYAYKRSRLKPEINAS